MTKDEAKTLRPGQTVVVSEGIQLVIGDVVWSKDSSYISLADEEFKLSLECLPEQLSLI